MTDTENAGRPLEGTVALVTGGASGIGRATARAFAAAGAAVAVLDRDAEGAKHVADELAGAGAMPVVCDLGQLDTIAGAVDSVLDRLGRVDSLVNCAGITGQSGTLLDFDLDDWRAVYAVNLEAPLQLMRLVGRHMVERGAGGRIVNVSSSSAFRAVQSQLAYGSSKAAPVQLTRIAAAELGPHGINVNAVAPGLTRSAITESRFDEATLTRLVTEGPLANLLGRISDAEDVAATILFLCLPASRQITGQTIHTSGGAVV